MLLPVYTRGQVTWVLWYLFSGRGTRVDDIPSKFKARIKNLLELDWKTKVPRRTGAYAFSQYGPAGTGKDVSFSAADAFCLAVAMDLVDASSKPGDVVFLLRDIRPALIKEYNWIIDHNGSLEGRLPHLAADDWPATRDRNGKEWADFHSFVLLPRLAIKEAFPLMKDVPKNTPVYLEPIFVRGVQALAREMENAGFHYRKTMVVELTGTSTIVTDLLRKAPQLKKGRP